MGPKFFFQIFFQFHRAGRFQRDPLTALWSHPRRTGPQLRARGATCVDPACPLSPTPAGHQNASAGFLRARRSAEDRKPIPGVDVVRTGQTKDPMFN